MRTNLPALLMSQRALIGGITALLVLSACEPGGGSSGPEPSEGAEAIPCDQAPDCDSSYGAGPPAEGDLPPGWDQTPDGAPPTPDNRLDSDALATILRTTAQAHDDPSLCQPPEVAARLQGFDVSLGHRFTSLRVRNTSGRACIVKAIPGVGARGEWGNTFQLTVEPGLPITPGAGPVSLDPGAEAAAVLEWTGELAASGAERASILVVQLAQGQGPVRVPAVESSQSLDLGMLSTLKVSPFEPQESS